MRTVVICEKRHGELKRVFSGIRARRRLKIAYFTRMPEVLKRIRNADMMLVDTNAFEEKRQFSKAIGSVKRIRPDLPIIVSAEKNSVGIERDVRKAGISYYIIKPYLKGELEKVFENFLG